MFTRAPRTIARLLSASLLTVLVIAGAESKTYPAAAADGVAVQSASIPVSIRLVSEQQYANIIRDVFGVSYNARRFAPVRRTEGLVTVGSSTAVITGGVLDLLDDVARDIAERVVSQENRNALIPCKPKNLSEADDACARAFFARTGRALFRRSLSSDELDTFAAMARSASLGTQSFYSGIKTALASMLIDPEFLYFIATAEPDPDNPGGYRLDGRSKAERLSLLLWNRSPDEELLRAAEAGELHTSEGLTRQIDRMLGSPRLQDGVRGFFDDMLVLEKFDNLVKDGTIYPAYTLKVRNDAREQTLRTIIDHLVIRDLDYRDLFTTHRTFLTQDLGTLYGVPVPAAGPDDWVPYTLPEADPRAGLLTQVAFLSAHSHPGRTSPTQRGRALREIFMCQKVPDPPANVDFSIIEDPNAKLETARDRLAMHNSEPNCAGCHKITDPIGLALESFDGAGQFRTHEGSALIDTSGALDGKAYADARGLGETVRNHPAVPSCLVNRLFQYALARPAAKSDRPVLAAFEKQFAAHGYRVRSLLKTLATSEVMYRVDSHQVAHATELVNGEQQLHSAVQ